MSRIQSLSLFVALLSVLAPVPVRALAGEGGAYTTGIYPDAFAGLLGKPVAEVQARLDTAFNRLFFGDDSTQRVYYPVGPDMGYIEDIANNDVRTEGMSYGMMIAVQMDRKDVFDRLWKWAKSRMQFTEGPHRGYFAWHCRSDGTVLDSTAASDGEEWFVTSLFFASARWGDGAGIFEYRREAQDILTTMLHKEDEPGHGRVTNMFDARTKLVTFVPSVGGNQFTDPSYQLPHYCELWARWAGNDNRFWREAARAARKLLNAAADPGTGLSPDYAQFDGRPLDFKRRGHGDFRFDAWRVAMNVAVDCLWFGRDGSGAAHADRLLEFFRSKGIRTYGNQFTLKGRQLADDHSAGLVAANAVAALAATRPWRAEFLREFWATPVPSGRYRYYDGLLYMLGMLQVSGNFRIYERGGSRVRFEMAEGGFPLSLPGASAPLCASAGDYPGVLRVLGMFQNDITAASGSRPAIVLDRIPASKDIVIVGTLGKSLLIDSLVRSKKIDVSGVAGSWETSLVQSVDNPFPGTGRALVIAGSDKRGTMYGMLELSGEIGVSPWHWWADVPVQHHAKIFVLPGRRTEGPPSVKYRGIFLNDEYPDLTNWVAAKYGHVPAGGNPPVPPGVAMYGHEFYERVFELLLRLRGNYLWPAMWNNAFNEDDPANAPLADEYGIVMGTSHQEPMLRAQKEWDRRYLGTLGTWNYATHADALETFWREGIRRNRSYESIITLGLRGANDTPMAPGGPEANMALLEQIVGVQRKMLSQEMNRDVTRVPQAWCLYKEVLEFYNAGMRVPDDVTLLWPDDNWGNVRRLPTGEERKRPGGAGIYYHFDYHGSPRSYQWINANPIAKIWDQMSFAKQYGADKIWIVNVGHLKGYELPIEYFMSLAWDATRWTGRNSHEFTRLWAQRQFGALHGDAIADIVTKTAMYNGRRKPELLAPATYSLTNYNEADRVVAEYNDVASRAAAIYRRLPAKSRDAFYELVLFPAKAGALVNELYVCAGKNALYARQGRSASNVLASDVRSLFTADTALMGDYNRRLAGGKWDHFMDQPHLGYTGWQDPPSNSLRAIPLREIVSPSQGAMGIAVEGSEVSWPGPGTGPVLPPFDRFNRQSRTIEVFNRGLTPFEFRARADKPWIKLSVGKGNIRIQERIRVAIDWSLIHRGNVAGSVHITGSGEEIAVGVTVAEPGNFDASAFNGFLESEGVVSVEAGHFTANTPHGLSQWTPVVEYGHTLSGMRGTAPPDAPPAVPGSTSACLEYRMFLTDTGKVNVEGIFGPTLNFLPGRGLHYAVSFDGESPQVVTLVPEVYAAGDRNEDWSRTVEDNARRSRTTHHIGSPGIHTLKFWVVDPGAVLEKVIVDCGGLKPSYLGPPESWHRIVADVE